jgi:hypothetical protein
MGCKEVRILSKSIRNNIAAARLGGLQKDLNITDTQYSTCLSILYVGYVCLPIAFPSFHLYHHLRIRHLTSIRS